MAIRISDKPKTFHTLTWNTINWVLATDDTLAPTTRPTSENALSVLEYETLFPSELPASKEALPEPTSNTLALTARPTSENALSVLEYETLFPSELPASKEALPELAGNEDYKCIDEIGRGSIS